MTNEPQLLPLLIIRLTVNLTKLHGNAYLTSRVPNGWLPHLLRGAHGWTLTPVNFIWIALHSRIILIRDLNFAVHVRQWNAEITGLIRVIGELD